MPKPNSRTDPDELQNAISDSDVERVRVLVATHPKWLENCNDAGQTPLQLAAYMGHAEIIEIIRMARIAPDIFECALLGDVSALERTLNEDETGTQQYSGDGWTALHLACFAGHPQACKVLLDSGADISAISRNTIANTPLHAALAGVGDLNVIKLLLEHGADANSDAAQCLTPLHLAASRGDLDAVIELQNAGARARKMDNGKMPHDLARERDHLKVAAFLSSC